jgi:hypothetical protein
VKPSNTSKPLRSGQMLHRGRKPKAEKPQRERFIEAARAIGVDETGEEFERMFLPKRVSGGNAKS